MAVALKTDPRTLIIHFDVPGALASDKISATAQETLPKRLVFPAFYNMVEQLEKANIKYKIIFRAVNDIRLIKEEVEAYTIIRTEEFLDLKEELPKDFSKTFRKYHTIVEEKTEAERPFPVENDGEYLSIYFSSSNQGPSIYQVDPLDVAKDENYFIKQIRFLMERNLFP